MKKRGQTKRDWFLILTYAVTAVVVVMSLWGLTRFSYAEFLDYLKHGVAWRLVLSFWAFTVVFAAASLIGLWLYKKGQKFSFTFKLFIVGAALKYVREAHVNFAGSGPYLGLPLEILLSDSGILALALLYHATNSGWVKGTGWKILYWVGWIAGLLGLLTSFVPINW